MTKALIVFVLAAVQLWAALPGTLAWEVRTTGLDTNGGAFYPNATGTDYSQQDAPQVTYADLVIGGSTDQLTSAAFPFSALSVGNVINITGGTGFTTGRYYIQSFGGSSVTVDRSVGVGGSTGGVGVLGGGLLTIQAAVTASVSTNEIFIQAGTYTQTANVSLSGKSLFLYGYQTTHNDGGTRPLITTATDSTGLFNSSGFGNFCSFSNINFSNTAAVRSYGIGSVQGMINVADATFDGFTVGVDGAVPSGGEGIYLSNVEIKNSTVIGTRFSGNSINYVYSIDASYIHDNALGVGIGNANSSVRISNTVIADNTGYGVALPTGTGQSLSLQNVTIANNGGDGVAFASGAGRIFSSVNSIFYGNGGYGINIVYAGVNGNPNDALIFRNNGYGSNTSGNASFTRIGTGVDPITITADPFTNSATGDYSLNSTAGGGALLSGTGYVGPLSTATLSVGAVQTSGGGAAPATLAYPLLQ